MAKRKRLGDPTKVYVEVYQCDENRDRYFGEVYLDAYGHKKVTIHQDPTPRSTPLSVERALTQWLNSRAGKRAIQLEMYTLAPKGATSRPRPLF